MEVPGHRLRPGSRCAVHPAISRAQSCVPASSIDDIVGWLGTCEYVSDDRSVPRARRLAGAVRFERRQRGDCEDFALWAWRKLIEIGVDAEFFVGRVDLRRRPADRAPARVGRLSRRPDALSVRAGRARSAAHDSAVVRREGRLRAALRRDRRFVTSAFVGCILDSHRRGVRHVDTRALTERQVEAAGSASCRRRLPARCARRRDSAAAPARRRRTRRLTRAAATRPDPSGAGRRTETARYRRARSTPPAARRRSTRSLSSLSWCSPMRPSAS